MPDTKDAKDPKKTEQEKKPAEYHNFLKVDRSLRPDGFHLCTEKPATK
jgi:hypothetical protein